MAEQNGNAGLLPACRELLDRHPESLRIREQVEALDDAMPDNPGVAAEDGQHV